MRHVIVYRLLFNNGKSYIGMTKSLSRRVAEHKLKARKGDNLPISNAIRKYTNFEVRVLSRHIKRDRAYGAEMFFIKKYNTIAPNGYNVCEGGPGVKGFTAQRERLSTQKQREASVKTANEVLRYYVNKKKVKVICSNGKVYDSIKQASIDLNLNATCIYRVLVGEQKQTGGYTFSEPTGKYSSRVRKHKARVKKSRKKLIERMKNKSKPIVRSDGVVFKSCEHASRVMRISSGGIRACLKGRSKTCVGFGFTYLES